MTEALLHYGLLLFISYFTIVYVFVLSPTLVETRPCRHRLTRLWRRPRPAKTSAGLPNYAIVFGKYNCQGKDVNVSKLCISWSESEKESHPMEYSKGKEFAVQLGLVRHDISFSFLHWSRSENPTKIVMFDRTYCFKIQNSKFKMERDGLLL